MLIKLIINNYIEDKGCKFMSQTKRSSPLWKTCQWDSTDSGKLVYCKSTRMRKNSIKNWKYVSAEQVVNNSMKLYVVWRTRNCSANIFKIYDLFNY